MIVHHLLHHRHRRHLLQARMMMIKITKRNTEEIIQITEMMSTCLEKDSTMWTVSRRFVKNRQNTDTQMAWTEKRNITEMRSGRGMNGERGCHRETETVTDQVDIGMMTRMIEATMMIAAMDGQGIIIITNVDTGSGDTVI